MGSDGLPASEVRELLRVVTIVGLPLAPSFVEGIINLRGAVVPVLDIRARLRMPAKAPEPTDYLLVIGTGERPVALRIDRALELKMIDIDEVESAGGVHSGKHDVALVAKVPEGLMLILSLADLASPNELAAIAHAHPTLAGLGKGGERS